jgi:hypothetical protein
VRADDLQTGTAQLNATLSEDLAASRYSPQSAALHGRASYKFFSVRILAAGKHQMHRQSNKHNNDGRSDGESVVPREHQDEQREQYSDRP